MRGANLKDENDLKLAVFTAWQIARLSVFNGGKLKPLSEELKKLRPSEQHQQSPEEIIAALRAIRETMGSPAGPPDQ